MSIILEDLPTSRWVNSRTGGSSVSMLLKLTIFSHFENNQAPLRQDGVNQA